MQAGKRVDKQKNGCKRLCDYARLRSMSSRIGCAKSTKCSSNKSHGVLVVIYDRGLVCGMEQTQGRIAPILDNLDFTK